MPLRRPRRLDNFTYVGQNAYSVTICTYRRHPAFLDHEFTREAIARLLRTAGKFGFEVIAYCFMPDHVHLLLLGAREDSDFKAFIKSWNTQTGFYWRRRTTGRLWQDGYYERVIRSDVNVYFAAQYIVMNPVRAGLVHSPGDYEFSGSTRYTIAQLLDDGHGPAPGDDGPKGPSLQESLQEREEDDGPEDPSRQEPEEHDGPEGPSLQKREEQEPEEARK